MGPIVKVSKQKAKKASAGAGLSSAREEKQVTTMITDVQAAWRDEKDLVGYYEPEEPPRFSPIEDDISIPEEHTPTPEEGASDISLLADDLPAFSAEDGPMVGGEALAIFSGAARTPSPPQTADLVEMDTDNHSPSTNHDVEMTGVPADARIKRRRGSEDAAVDGGSIDVGRSVHGVGEADAEGVSVDVGRPSTGSPSTG